MKNVTYKSCSSLGCACGSQIIICVDSALTVSGKPYIEGTLGYITTSLDVCSNTLYTYYLSYDEAQLLAPTVPLVATDVSGVICRGCLTQYIDAEIAAAVADLLPQAKEGKNT